MTTNKSSYVSGKQTLFAAILISGLAAAFAMPQNATASTGAGATILNKITLTYSDTGATKTYTADATTTVTVALVKAPLTASGKPTGAAPGKTAAMPAGLTVDSGNTASYLIALTANANGGDTYNLTSALATPANVSNQTVAWSTVAPNGTTVITGSNPATINLGASIIQANAATTISIPGGSTLAAAIQDKSFNKVIVVNGVDYLVTGFTPGTAPSNAHVGATQYTDVSLTPPTPESLAVVTLEANPGGSNQVPAFTVNALKGTQAGEQILVKVDIAANVTNPISVGTVDFTVTTNTSAGVNQVITAAITTTFRAMNLKIMKSVRNCGPLGTTCAASYSASLSLASSPSPGDILEYQVQIQNAGASLAKLVRADDAVPVYTTLMCYSAANFSTAQACAATSYFATINDGTSTQDITFGSANNECAIAPLNVGAGDAGGSSENSPIHFFIGNTCNATTGGQISPSAVYTIVYRMKIN